MNDNTRILIVEDRISDYQLAQREVRKALEHCVFERAETRAEFLAALSSFQPHLILCDYSLPNFDGMSALQLTQEHAPFTPLIIWTGSISEDVAVDCMRAGAANYVLKEEIKRLGPAIRRGLEESQLLRERRQAERKYQDIFDHSPIGVFQSTPAGRFLNVNAAMARIYGYDSPEEMIASVSSIADQLYVAPEERHIFLRLLESQGVVQEYEWKNMRKDGSVFWTLTWARAVRDTAGNVLYYEGFLQDITDRKLADARVAESEKRFRALIENGMDNISLLAADGTLLWENPTVNYTLGYGRDAFLNRNIFELMHPEDAGWTAELFADLVREPGSQKRGTFRLRHKDGTWRWIEATATNMLEEPSVKAVVINYRDVTERKNAEEELRESQAKYRNLVETSHDLIWSVDADGRFTFVNAAARQIYGYEPDELIEQFYFDIMDHEHDHLTPKTFRESIAARHGSHTSEVYVRHKDGRQRILSANSIVLRHKNGDLMGVMGSSRDITEKKRAEVALQEERNLLRTLVDHLPDRVYAMDRQGRKTLSNIADWKACGGKTMEDVIGKTDFDLYPMELAEPFWQVDKAVLESGEAVINIEEPGLDSDGRQVSILTSKIPLRDDAGNVIGLVGIGRDITERKRVEESLRENEQRYRTLFEDMPIAIWEEDLSAVKAQLENLKSQGITDLRAYFSSHPEERRACESKFRILDVNHAAVEMYRARDKEHLIEETIRENSRGEEEHGLEDLIAIAEGRTSNSWEGADETCDKIPLQIRQSWSVVPGHEKNYSKVILTTIDITESKQMEATEREQRTLAEALRDTSQILNSTLDYGEVLDHILNAVDRVVPHSAGTIMLIEGSDAHVVRSHGYEKQGVKDEVHGVRLPVAATNNLRKMLETHQPVIVYDTHAEPGWKRLEVTEWLRSNVGAPISIQGEVIGFILLDSDTPGFFTPLHAERLESFANQAALAIHNARLLQQAREEIAERKRTEAELQHKNEDLRLLNAVNTAIVRGQNLDSIINLLAVELKRIFAAVGATIYMLSSDKQSLTMQQYAFSPETEHRVEKLIGYRIPKIQIPIQEGGHFHNTLLTKQSAITSDPKKIQEWIAEFTETSFLPPIARAAVRKLVPHIYRLLNIKSTIIVPLISREEVIGFLDVSGSYVFTREDLKRIEAIAEQLTAIIQRQQVNERVRKSEEFLQGVQNALSAHVAILNENGVIVQVNDAWRRFGEQNGLQSANHCIGMNYLAVCEATTGADAEAAQQVASTIRQVLSGELEQATGEYGCDSPTEKRWFTVHITCFDDGARKWIILAHENITERKAAEIAAMERTAQFRTLFEASPDAIVLIDPAGDWPIIDCNSAAAKMNGYTREEMIGKPIDILNPEKDTPEGRLTYLEKVRGAEVLRYETIHVHKDGSPIAVEVSTTLIQLGDRQMVLGIDRDITVRKQIEEKLQQSEVRYRTVVENQTEFIVRWKPDGTRTFVNDAYCRYFGVTQEQALHTDFMPLVHEDDLPIVNEKIARLVSGASRVETESHRVIRPDGSVCWNEWTDQAVTDENGQLVEFQAVGRDITERKLAEQELREEQEKAQKYLDIAGVMMLALGPDGNVSLINQKGLEILGYSSEEILGKNWIQTFIPEVMRAEMQDVFQKLIEAAVDSAPYYENPVLTRHGEERMIAWHNTVLRDANGRILTSLSSGEDVTERKRAEQELRDSEERFRQLAENIEEAFWITDARTGQELYLSPAVEKIWGRPARQLMTEPDLFLTCVVPEDRAIVLDGIEKERHGEKWEMEYRIVHPDGSIRWIWDRAFPILDENGRVYKLAGISTDITERKQTEESLRTSEERYRGLFRNLVNGFALHELVTDDQGRPVDYIFLEINPAFEKLTGLRSQDVIGHRVSEVMPGIEQEQFIITYGQVALTGQPIHFESYSKALGKHFEINAYSPQPNRFATTFIDVTERKAAEEEINRRAEETAALLDASLALNNLDLTAILQSIGTSAKDLFHADGCRIFLMQPDGQSLRCVLALQENAGALSNLSIKLGEGVTGSVALHGRAEIVNEMHKDPRAGHIPGTADSEEESIMFAPIKERERTIGVLSVRRAGSDRPFAQPELALLEAFASMAASAVSNARLFEETERRLSELEALYENGLAVGRLLEPKEIGEQIIQTFARHLSWHHVTIRLVRPETDELELIAYNVPGLADADKAEMEARFNQMVPKSGQGLSGSVVQSGMPLRTGDVHQHPQYVDTQAGIQSGLYMPMKVGKEVIGVISVESELSDAFTEQDERLLATLGNQAAIAFENARLYQAAQQELAERKRAQEALWASESHYRQLADSITDILFELDQDLHYTHWNKASEMFSGIPAEDAIGKPMRELWGESKDQLEREEIYRYVLRERQAKTFETEIIAKGEKRILEVSAYPSTRGASVVAKDITERRLSETLLQKRFELMEYAAHHSLDELMQQTIDVVSEMTDSHIGFLHFVESDQKTVRLQAWSTETIQMVGRIEEKGTHAAVDTAGVWADTVRQRKSVIHNDYESLPQKNGLPDGHVPLTREMVIPIIRNDKVVAVLGLGNKPKEYTSHDLEIVERFADYAWDVTERRQMESALAEERNQLALRVEERTADLSRANSNLARALRVKDEFLANMSHELRTPLNAILGLSESLSEQVAGPLNEKQQKYLSTINESGHHLLSLINDILGLAKIEAGQVTLDINKVDVSSVCQASLRMIKQLAQRKHQDVNFEIDPDIGWMWADERRLKQMIVNLLSNAVKFTPESGTLGLEVRGDRVANRVSISVWDKGIGISDRDLGRLFQPFVQLDAGLAREASGTGLGLALVAQMARLHGGSVTVDSQHSQGSRFTILLPWEPALAADLNSRLRSSGKFRAIKPDEIRPTILLIEDTQEVVMMLVDYLEMAGFRMVTAQDGVDGLTQAKLSHPDLILMDIQMPRLDGFETTRRLRSDPEFRDTPIIALTALAMPNDRERCLEAGMNEYMSKPVNLKALAKTIKTFLYEAEAGSS